MGKFLIMSMQYYVDWEFPIRSPSPGTVIFHPPVSQITKLSPIVFSTFLLNSHYCCPVPFYYYDYYYPSSLLH